MARNNGILVFRGLSLLVMLVMLAGCASYQGQLAFESAEQLVAEEDFDPAVEKYAEAIQLDPGNKRYKLKLIAARTRAAAMHIRQARILAQEGRVEEAVGQYRIARDLDPSLEIAAFEEMQLQKILEAEKLADEGLAFYQKKELTSARRVARKALQLAPDNPKVLELMALLEKAEQVVAMDGVELDVASAEPLTLRFKDAKIKEVFKVLTKLTGINFILDEDVRDQPISVFLEQASFAQAMELILQMNGLEKKVLNSKTIVIYPQSRDKDKQYGDQIIQTFYLSHIDAKKAVNMLRTMLQLRKVYVHEERNALVVRDKPDVIRLAEQILDAADREDSEVIFNLELVSVSDTDSLKFGPELSTYSVGVGFSEDGTTIVKDTLGTTTDGLVQSLNNLQTFYTLPSATFNFAKTLSGTQILASPKIRVRNNEKGKVHVGTREPIVTTTTSDGGTVSENITYIDVGVKVDVEPNIQLGNSVETKLTLEVSQIIERLPPTSNGSIPLRISTTNAQTVLTLKDGVQTIIGGLFSQDESKSKKTVPWLGEIPVVGDLFGSLDNTDTKREILLSITPYIVKQLEVPGEDIATIWSGGEDNLKAGPNFGAFARPLESEVESVRPVAAPSLKQEPSSVLPAAKSFPGTADQTSVDSAVHSGTVPAPVESSGESAAGMTAFPESREAAPAEGSVIPAERRLPVKRLAGPVPLAELASPAAPVLALVGPRSAAVGEEFMLTVEVKNVASLYSAPLFINYDPVRLSLQGVDEGGFLEEDGPGAVFSSNVKQDVGQIVVGYKQDAGGTGASGSGPLFILRFKTLAAGSALVDLNRINFRDPQGVRLDVQAANARIEIR